MSFWVWRRASKAEGRGRGRRQLYLVNVPWVALGVFAAWVVMWVLGAVRGLVG